VHEPAVMVAGMAGQASLEPQWGLQSAEFQGLRLSPCPLSVINPAVFRQRLPLLLLLCLFPGAAALAGGDEIRIAQYNVETYLDQPTESRPAKSEAAKARVRDSILALKPDVIALEEMGTTNALIELQSSLKSAGLDLPYWEHVSAYDTNIHVAILSRFPFTARRPHTNDSFLLAGRRFQVKRGFAEVDIRVNDHFAFTLIAAHLKSKVPTPEADQAELRFEEAKKLRELVDTRLNADPNVNLVVLGDFNDLPDSEPIRAIIGPRGKRSLVDTRPAESNGDDPPAGDRRAATRKVAWTDYYAKDDVYSRIDYILLSHSMARVWDPANTRILTTPNWGVGSDHRPLVAAFELPKD
jgi:endonuclease/exonuclease/phosphatase family metal-dependent hydrolase